MKNWKTTIAGVTGALLTVLGAVMPGTFDPETQTITYTAISNILIAVGSVITVINAVKAKDPK